MRYIKTIVLILNVALLASCLHSKSLFVGCANDSMMRMVDESLGVPLSQIPA